MTEHVLVKTTYLGINCKNIAHIKEENNGFSSQFRISEVLKPITSCVYIYKMIYLKQHWFKNIHLNI